MQEYIILGICILYIYIYTYVCVWCVCMDMYIRTKIHNGGNYAHAHV